MKARDLIKMPVVVTNEAEPVGAVYDVVVGQGFEVQGLVVEGKGGEKNFVASTDFTIGEDSVLIPTRKGLKPDSGREESIYKKKIGDTVLDTEGREIGIISDLVIEPESKQVTGIEISCGIIQDFLTGKRAEISLSSIRVSGMELTMVGREEGS